MQGLSADELVGVVGGGAMGSGIAQVAAAAGHPVVVLDTDQDRAERAVHALLAGLRRGVDKGRIAADVLTAAERTASSTTSVDDLSDCGLVVEAIVEDLEAKRKLFRSLDSVVADSAVLATNTSSLSIDAIAASLRDPGRLVGMHFFNPATAMRLVEVVTGLRSDVRAADLVEATAQAWGKATVRCASTPGFVVNRVARPFYSEALAVVAETRLAPRVVDELFRESGGFRMGPLELTDLIGQDVNAAVTASVWRGLDQDPRTRPSLLQRGLVEAGWLGRKTGRGFYDHTTEAEQRVAVLPAPHVAPVQLGPDCPLGPLLSRTGCRVDEVAGLGRWARLASGALLGLTEGALAVEEAHRAGGPVVLLDLPLDWALAKRVGAAASEPSLLDELAALLASAEVAVTALPDVPGLLLARTVALLVDEAVDLAHRQGLPPEVVDDAVRLGLNYPLGPHEWGDRAGAGWVVRLLDAMERLQPGGRFRVSTPLRAAALTAGRLHG